MSMAAAILGARPFDAADETRTPPNASIDIVRIGNHSIARYTFQPGWTWHDSVGPTAGTDHCMKEHVGYVESGALEVWLTDGTRTTMRAGEAYVIPPGHDAKVVGDEPFVGIEFASAESYAKS